MSARRVRSCVFDTAWVSDLVATRWGWKGAQCVYWNRSHNDVYQVEAGGRRAYLRISRHGWRTRDGFEGEAALLRFLHRAGVNVAKPVRARDGAYAVTVRAPEGARHAVLFTEVPGVVPEMDRSGCARYGRLVAAMHLAADRSRVRFERPALDRRHLVEEPLRELAPLLSHRPRDWASVRRAGAGFEAAVSALPGDAPAVGLCHGDLHFGNVHRDSRGRFTLLDFDCSGYGPRAYDLATFLWARGWGFDRAARSSRTRQWNAFLEGYSAVRVVSRTELRAAERLVPIRHLWHLGTQARLARDFGRRWLDEASMDEHLAFLREWNREHGT